jgi:hypothetical protein
MNKYREEHQPHRHDHRALVHGEPQSELTETEIELVEAELTKLRRQIEVGVTEHIEAIVTEIEESCFQILSRKDDGSLPPVVIQLKAELEDARDQYLR